MPLTDEEEARFAAIARDNKLEDIVEKEENNRIKLILICCGFLAFGFVLIIAAVMLKAIAGGVAGFAIAVYGGYHLSKQFMIKP